MHPSYENVAGSKITHAAIPMLKMVKNATPLARKVPALLIMFAVSTVGVFYRDPSAVMAFLNPLKVVNLLAKKHNVRIIRYVEQTVYALMQDIAVMVLLSR